MNASMGEQIRIYFGKNGRIFFNEKKYISIILSTVLMTLMIGMVTGSEMFAQYSATRNGAFALVCACIWIGIFNSIQSICKERATIKEEKRNNGLDLMAYTLAHVLFDAIICFCEALLVTLIIFLLKKNNIQVESSFPTITILKYLFTFFFCQWKRKEIFNFFFRIPHRKISAEHKPVRTEMPYCIDCDIMIQHKKTAGCIKIQSVTDVIVIDRMPVSVSAKVRRNTYKIFYFIHSSYESLRFGICIRMADLRSSGWIPLL